MQVDNKVGIRYLNSSRRYPDGEWVLHDSGYHIPTIAHKLKFQLNPLLKSKFLLLSLGDSEINNWPFLLVFRLVFCVASRVAYPDMRPLMRLEYEPKSCAISGNYLFPSP
jgi:hypothetical protein